MTNNNICIKQCVEWLEKEMNRYDLLYFEVLNAGLIGAYFKTRPGVRFCVFYVNVIQRIIEEKEFESEGG